MLSLHLMESSCPTLSKRWKIAQQRAQGIKLKQEGVTSQKFSWVEDHVTMKSLPSDTNQFPGLHGMMATRQHWWSSERHENGRVLSS